MCDTHWQLTSTSHRSSVSLSSTRRWRQQWILISIDNCALESRWSSSKLVHQSCFERAWFLLRTSRFYFWEQRWWKRHLFFRDTTIPKDHHRYCASTTSPSVIVCFITVAFVCCLERGVCHSQLLFDRMTMTSQTEYISIQLARRHQQLSRFLNRFEVGACSYRSSYRSSAVSTVSTHTYPGSSEGTYTRRPLARMPNKV